MSTYDQTDYNVYKNLSLKVADNSMDNRIKVSTPSCLSLYVCSFHINPGPLVSWRLMKRYFPESRKNWEHLRPKDPHLFIEIVPEYNIDDYYLACKLTDIVKLPRHIPVALLENILPLMDNPGPGSSIEHIPLHVDYKDAIQTNVDCYRTTRITMYNVDDYNRMMYSPSHTDTVETLKFCYGNRYTWKHWGSDDKLIKTRYLALDPDKQATALELEKQGVDIGTIWQGYPFKPDTIFKYVYCINTDGTTDRDFVGWIPPRLYDDNEFSLDTSWGFTYYDMNMKDTTMMYFTLLPYEAYNL